MDLLGPCDLFTKKITWTLSHYYCIYLTVLDDKKIEES